MVLPQKHQKAITTLPSQKAEKQNQTETFNAPKCPQFALLFTQHQTTLKVAAVPAAPLGVVAPFPGAQNLSRYRGAYTTMHNDLCAMPGAATNRLCVTAPFKHEWLGFLMLPVLRCLDFKHIKYRKIIIESLNISETQRHTPKAVRGIQSLPFSLQEMVSFVTSGTSWHNSRRPIF